MISGLHHYALEVPDLAVAEGFLQDFGLETGEKDGSLVAMCPGRDQEQVRLVQAPAKRLHHVTFTLRPGTMDAVRGALERSGTPVIEVTIGADGKLLKSVVRRSSGHAELDEAALRILKLASPYDPFPSGLNATHDEIRIAYEWQFLGGAEQGSGVYYDDGAGVTK